MPIFEYRCRVCDHRFELIVSGSTRPVCPRCESAQLEKQLSVFAVGAHGSSEPTSAGPCGRCGHPDGPGACSFD